MIICIIAGGSGTRLWPLSTSAYPKHLLKVNGDTNSLLQNTYERAKQLTDNIFVVTEDGHAKHIFEQLPELPKDRFIVEPARRGTASCIVTALCHVSTNYGDDEPVAIMYADHYIRDIVGFAHSFRIAETVSEESNRLVLVGVEPNHPSTGFGYIRKGSIYDEERLVYEVHSFKEKPDYNTALSYVRSGHYLWNCGYFIGSVQAFKDKMAQYAPELLGNFHKLKNAKNEDQANEIYLSFENEAIDYALVEKVPDLLVVPASFDWMDLGSYGDLHKAVGLDEAGNYQKGYVELDSVENSYIENHEDKPVAVIGLDNVVVINTKDGILVTRKDLGQKVGEIAKKIAKREVL